MNADDTTFPTLHQALAARGYRTEPAAHPPHARRIIRVADSAEMGTVRAGEAWMWLREREPEIARLEALREAGQGELFTTC